MEYGPDQNIENNGLIQGSEIEEIEINAETKTEPEIESEIEGRRREEEERSWWERLGLNADTLCGAIETIIFMSDRPIPLVKIRNLIHAELPLRMIHQSLAHLQEEYEQKLHGFRLQEVAEGYQFRTKPIYSKYVQELFRFHSLVLTPSALEVLAIIAYKQPVSRMEIDKVRGVDSSHIVRTLMDKRLVRIKGRSNELGKPVTYATTNEFLEVFNLSDISQLPPEDELEALATYNMAKPSEIKELVRETDKKRFHYDEIHELDQLSENIKAIKADTQFTKSLRLEDRKRISENKHGNTPVTSVAIETDEDKDNGVKSDSQSNAAESELRSKAKTAFELLEEFVEQKTIADQNKAAAESELLMSAVLPEVVSNFDAAPFINAPSEEDDDDEFEMIDLNTGERLGIVEAEPLFKKDLSSEVETAFSMLMNESKSSEFSDFDEEFPLNEEEVEETTKALDKLQNQMINKADELDLDLSFMNNEE